MSAPTSDAAPRNARPQRRSVTCATHPTRAVPTGSRRSGCAEPAHDQPRTITAAAGERQQQRPVHRGSHRRGPSRWRRANSRLRSPRPTGRRRERQPELGPATLADVLRRPSERERASVASACPAAYRACSGPTAKPQVLRRNSNPTSRPRPRRGHRSRTRRRPCGDLPPSTPRALPHGVVLAALAGRHVGRATPQREKQHDRTEPGPDGAERDIVASKRPLVAAPNSAPPLNPACRRSKRRGDEPSAAVPATFIVTSTNPPSGDRHRNTTQNTDPLLVAASEQQRTPDHQRGGQHGLRAVAFGDDAAGPIRDHTADRGRREQQTELSVAEFESSAARRARPRPTFPRRTRTRETSLARVASPQSRLVPSTRRTCGGT